MLFKSFALEQYYLPGKPVLPLAAACEHSADGEIARACISDQCDLLSELVQQGESLDSIASALRVAVLDFSAPFRLQPVHIPKPWGQEIWYTGIEARGVSCAISDTGSTPLSWVIALDRERILGNYQQPNLLKILDPLPDDVYGDLYFELHEQKREVYIVTHVDPQAWPDGIGAIRYGFSREQREQFLDDASFLHAYRSAVRDYRAVRCELDSRMDALRARDGIGLNEPVSAFQTRRWLAELPQDLQTNEATLRMQMDKFTAMRPLKSGDVLAVPLLTPHALQHGVRTVEFQTPVYERKILSFAQKVLTQDHWDTDAALQMAALQTPADEDFPVLLDAQGVKIEEIVRFDDFSVQRVYLAAGAEYIIPAGKEYRLLMVVTGSIECNRISMSCEQAALVPLAAGAVSLHNKEAVNAECLLAQPVCR